jgi:hypothetical protein
MKKFSLVSWLPLDLHPAVNKIQQKSRGEHLFEGIFLAGEVDKTPEQL